MATVKRFRGRKAEISIYDWDLNQDGKIIEGVPRGRLVYDDNGRKYISSIKDFKTLNAFLSEYGFGKRTSHAAANYWKSISSG